MKANLSKIIDFIARNATWFIIGAISLYLLKPSKPELQTFFFIAALEAMALFFSNVALFVFTKIPFTKLILEGKDKEFNEEERKSLAVVLGYVFVGVHVLIGLVVLGVYIAQFAN